MVVDYDKSILIVSRAILEAEGYSVDTAETGQEAIELSNTKDYNLALLASNQKATKSTPKGKAKKPFEKSTISGFPGCF